MSASEAAGPRGDPSAPPVSPPVSYQALGTTVTVVVHGEEAAAAAALDAVRGEVAAIDAACSRFRDDSELSQVNALAGRAVPVGPLLLEAVAVALRAARITGGLVDPTLGRPLRLLGYDRDFSSLPTSMLAVPSPAPSASGSAVSDAADHPGAVLTLVARAARAWEQVSIDGIRGTITVPEGVELDLGATAKALAVDRATAAAAGAAARASGGARRALGSRTAGPSGRGPGSGGTGAPGVLVSIGGDLAVAGTPPPGGWTIRVTDDHKAGDHEPGQTIAIVGGAVATSGTTVRRWYRGTSPVHHLLDPATGLPAAPYGGPSASPPRHAWTPTPPAPPP